MKRALLLPASLIAALVLAHPGGGIVALGPDRVLTGDAVGNGVWLFGTSPPTRQLSDFHCHWITRGLDGNLYAEKQGARNGEWVVTIYRLDRQGKNPERLWTSTIAHSVFTADRQGRLVFPDGGRLVTRESSGRLVAFRGDGRPVAGEPAFDHVSALVWGPGDALYLCDGPHVRKVGSDGKVRLLKTFEGKPTVEMYGGRSGARVWGLAVDGESRVYAALTSHGQVVRIAPNGQTTVVARSVDDWHATGVAVHGDTLFLLETKLEGNRNLGPRVRRVAADGRATVLGTVGTASR
ncbi:MAG: hypothetical protein AMXMBFR81_29850 [Chthonomonas sp.]